MLFVVCAGQGLGLDSEHLDGAQEAEPQEEDGECHHHRWPEAQPQISPLVALVVPLLVSGGRRGVKGNKAMFGGQAKAG